MLLIVVVAAAFTSAVAIMVIIIDVATSDGCCCWWLWIWTRQAWSLWRQDVSIIKSDLYRRKKIGKINDTRNLFDKMPGGNLFSSRVISIYARNWQN